MTAAAPQNAAAERNKGPILDVLLKVLPEKGLVLEIASGTGQHVAHFAAVLPALTWQPTDANAAAIESIAANVSAATLGNVNSALQLDVMSSPWPVVSADALLCINMIHISPWAATVALFGGASDLLGAGSVVFLYGPYRRYDGHTAPSNEAFDASLRARNPSWGIRDLEAVVATAEAAEFALEDVIAMPANNFSVVFRRTS